MLCNFQVGKQFDALLINIDAPSPANPVFDVFESTTFEVSPNDHGSPPVSYRAVSLCPMRI